jgi:hypothetical protein
MKMQVTLKSDKKNVYITWRPVYTFDHILITSLREREMFQTKVVEEIKMHIQ